MTKSNSDTDETIIYAMPYDFDEYTVYTADSYATKQWNSAVYASLLKRSHINHDWEPDLASSMPRISADGRTYRFSLKDNLTFSNGHELTTADIEFSFHVALSPLINTASYGLFEGFLDKNSINVVNSKTVEFTLLVKYAFPFPLLAFPIVDQEFFEDRYNSCLHEIFQDCIWDNEDGDDVVSAGPYMVYDIDNVNEIVTVIANPYYYDVTNIYTDKIIFQKIADKDAAISALASGLIDILDSQYVPGLNELADLEGVTVESVGHLSHRELSLNHLNPYYGTGEAIPGNENATFEEKYEDGLIVRKAMSHIVNREHIVNEIWDGLAREAATVMPEAAIGFDETIIPRKFSIEVARNYMKMAGFDYATLGNESENGIFEKNFFNITMLSPNGAPARNQWYSNYVLQLPTIGIGVKEHVSTGWGEIGPRTFGHYGELPPSYEEGGFDIFAVGYSWGLDWNPSSLYDATGRCDIGDCGNFYNFDIYENKTNIAKLVRSYLDELDFDIRVEKVKLVQMALYNNIPVLPVFYRMSNWGFNDELMGIDSSLLAVSMQDWAKVRKGSFQINVPTFSSSGGSSGSSIENSLLIGLIGLVALISYRRYKNYKKI